MKIFFTLFFISICLNHSSWGYSKKDIKLSKFEFDRYVKPQLTSITQDFYTLISVINPEIKPLKPLAGQLAKLKKISTKLQISCAKSSKESCLEGIITGQNIIDKSIKTLQTEINFNDKSHFTANDLLIYFDHSFTLNSQFEWLKQQLDIIYILSMTKKDAKIYLSEFEKNLIHTENILNDFFIRSSDARFRNEFMSFWSDFIRPVNNIILPQDAMDIFTVKINDLNLRLHFLNVALTKRNKKITKQAKTLLQVMHNRWNNILKVTLRN